MAASVNPLLPGKQQPLKSPKFLRHGCNMKSNAAKRKSAVELLQESKAFYVKSEKVLDAKQELKHSEHLQVTSNPSYDVLLRHPLRSAHGWDASSSSSSSSGDCATSLMASPRRTEQQQQQQQQQVSFQRSFSQGIEPKFLTVTLLGSARLHAGVCTSRSEDAISGRGGRVARAASHRISSSATPQSQLQAPLPPKSPRLPQLRSKTQPPEVSRPHDYRRSHSERDNSDDIQMKLRRLLNTDSKENLNFSPNADFDSKKKNNNNNRCNHQSSTKDAPVPPPPPESIHHGAAFSAAAADAFIKPRHQQEGNYCIHKSMPDLSPLQFGGTNGHCGQRQDGSNDSFLVKAAKSIDLKPPSWTTSDYVSRSPSSHRRGSPRHLGGGDDDSAGASSGGGLIEALEGAVGTLGRGFDGIRRRPILRSKSDISHRYSKSGTDLSTTGSPKKNSRCGAELERFFDTMGLDSSVLYVLNTPPSNCSSPVFFASVSTESSSCCCARSQEVCGGDTAEGGDSRLANGSGSPTEGYASRQTCRDGLSNVDLLQHGPAETSIVERNARVVKWLYNCRKLQGLSTTIEGSSAKGSSATTN